MRTAPSRTLAPSSWTTAGSGVKLAAVRPHLTVKTRTPPNVATVELAVHVPVPRTTGSLVALTEVTAIVVGERVCRPRTVVSAIKRTVVDTAAIATAAVARVDSATDVAHDTVVTEPSYWPEARKRRARYTDVCRSARPDIIENMHGSMEA